MAFSVDFIERLKAANPIEEVMSEYVTTKRSGRDYVCLCPFHNEKTPSCHIHPNEEYFHCFGCNAGGDVITFIMKYHNLDYVEAVKLLAERANIDMPIDSYYSGINNTVNVKKRMYEMNRDAAHFFYKQLSTPEGRGCVSYLMQTRGLSVETIKRYGIGFAPNSWSALKTYMLGKGYSEKELEAAGLISRSKNDTRKTFDFFVNRAMFPFIDLTGNIVGFGGRTLGDDKRKYVNTPDTAVYNKNRFLFSMNIAKNAAVKDGRILLCEGNLDVISLTQAGFENAVASCGTALTEQQAKIISNYAKKVVICYDSDEAGQRATRRAIDILNAAGLETSVIKMQGAKDPDEYVKKFGAAAFNVLLSNADGAVNYELSKARDAIDMSSDIGKLEFKDAAVAIIAKLESSVERELYGRKIAEEIGISYASFEAELQNALNKNKGAKRRKQNRDMLRFADRRDSVNTEASRHFGESKAEEMIIAYLYDNPDYAKRASELLSPDKLVTDFNRRVYEFMLKAIERDEEHRLSAMNACFTPDEIGKITQIVEQGRAVKVDFKVAEDSIQRLLDYSSNQLSAGDMSDDEFLDFAQRLRAKKS